MISTRQDQSRVSFAGSSSPTPSDNSFKDSYSNQLNHQDDMTSSNTTIPQNLLTRLEGLLLAKAQEIQLAGRLGESLLGQQAELEERIKELSEVERLFADSPAGLRRNRGLVGGEEHEASDGEKEVGVETKKKLTELEEELKRWDEANSDLYHTVGMAAAQGVPSIETLSQESQEMSDRQGSHSRNGSLDTGGLLKMKSTKDLTSQLAGGDSLAASRRARNNGQHRTNDIELATEIGQSLLGEVRRLQALLSERDEQLRDGKEERNNIERELEGAIIGRRTIEESVDKYKEENWNLELASQELRTHLADATTSLHKSDTERTRITKDLLSTRDLLETQRSESERLAAQLELVKAKNETDMATMRKHTAGLQREKSDLISSVDLLKVELANKSRSIKRNGSNSALNSFDGEGLEEDVATASQEEGDDFRSGAGRRKTAEGLVAPSSEELYSEYGDDSIDGSPARNGTDAASLKLSLAHAQRTISTLKASLAREKAARIESRRQIGDGSVSGQAESEEEDDVSSSGTPIRPSPIRSARGSARGGRGGSSRRIGGGGIGVPSRLGRVENAGDSSIDDEDEEAEVDGEQEDSFDLPAGSIFEHQFPSHDQNDESFSENGTDGGFDSPSRPRFSTDMDPEYANVLDGRNSIDSSRSISSFNPHHENLASDIGDGSFTAIGARPISGIFATSRSVEPLPLPILSPVKIWADAETMTDFPEPIPIPAYIPPPPPQLSTVAIQTVVVPIPVVATTDFAGQTEPEPIIDMSETGTSTDPPATTVEFATSTDLPLRSEMEIQTDEIPIVVPVVVPVVAPVVTPVEEVAPISKVEHSEIGVGALAALGTAALGVGALGVAAVVSTSHPSGDVADDSFSSAPRMKANGKTPFVAKIPAITVIETGVQTDDWKPEPEPTPTPLPLASIPSRLTTLADSDSKRDSINTFGRSKSPELIEESAATASAFLVTSPTVPELRSESALSGYTEDTIDSSTLAPISALDKGKGPMLPPPIPLKSALKPSRPTSPPPADLLHRAQTSHDHYDSSRNLAVPGSGSRSLRKQTSSSLAEYGLNPARRSGLSVSNMSIHSDVTHRMSMASSRTSEGGFETPIRSSVGVGAGDSTDPAVIHAITQTMIGEFLYKYTRRAIGKGISEKRHKRFFWIHPYTKALFWSASDHGGANTTQSSSKSVFIEGVREVADGNPFPPGLHSASIIISTPNREMKLTAPTRERHDMWINAINYLLDRPDPASSSIAGTPRKAFSSSPLAQSRALNSQASQSDIAFASNLGRGSVKRSGTAASDYERQSVFGSPRSIRTFASSIGGENRGETSMEIIEKRDIPGEYEQYDDDDDGYEGLENVRACCNGKHDVGSLTRNHHHHEPSRTANSSTNSRQSYRGTNATANSSRRVAVPSVAHSRKSSVASFATAPAAPLNQR